MAALFPPGSTLWLLGHDIRLGLRGFTSPKNGKGRRRIMLVVVVLGALALAATGGLEITREIARTRVTPSPLLYLGIDAGLAWLFTLMLAQTLTMATQVFYERNDLDLLLSSPISPRRVLTVRTLGLALFASTTYLFLSAILVVPLAFAGRPEFLCVWGVILSLGLFAASAGLSLALALFAVIGPRRTRVISQILAAVIGMTLFLMGQARNLLPAETLSRLEGRIAHADLSSFRLDAAYTWPARAVLGDVTTTLLLLATALLVFLATSAAVGRRFAADAAAGAGVSSVGDRRAAARRAASGDRAEFGDGTMRALVRKDLRLLIRDPWLISQVGLQLVYFVFLTVVAVRAAGRHGEVALGSGAAALVFICGQLAGNLTWVVISAEDAPELIACAPVAPGQVARAKLIAGLGPTAALGLVAVLVFAVLSPFAALATAFGMAGAAGSSGLMNLWYAKPANRKEFRRRRTTGGWSGLVELILMLLWAAGTAVIAYSVRFPPMALASLIPIGLALAILFVARRPHRYGIALPG